MNQMTPKLNNINSEPVLYMAFELGDKSWRLGFSNGIKQRQKTVEALKTQEVLKEIARAKEKLGLQQDCLVISCYEAGWEGFWLSRWLESEGIINYVLDSSSIEVNRKAKQTKTDRIDAEKLISLLTRYSSGEKKAIRIVKVPTALEEDRRQLDRERDCLVKERSRHWIRIKSLLRSQGIRVENKPSFDRQLETITLWNGEMLGSELKERLFREWQRHQLVDGQIKALEKKQKQLIDEPETHAHKQIAQLMMLKAVGYQSSWRLVMEFFSWRNFKNRRELAALAGLTPTPYNSGDSQRDQGISKSGNRRVRTLLIELSWMWLRYQPNSELTQWFEQRFGKNGKRHRRIGIVALARKLLIALWRYLETGEIPQGAVLKTI